MFQGNIHLFPKSYTSRKKAKYKRFIYILYTFFLKVLLSKEFLGIS